MKYVADSNRYKQMIYNRCGTSGLKLPLVSLGLWHNFGTNDDIENCKAILKKAFDLGITHFDLANNYGPLPGSAETNFGKILQTEFKDYRDELIISTKAGYEMWDGPYGEWGSRKYLIASIDQSLKRMGLDYVDIFYHHRADPQTDILETALALDHIVKSGKALYVGISNYDAEQTAEMTKVLKELKTPFIIHQFRYNMFDRIADREGLINNLQKEGIGSIVYSPLAQGVLTDRYLEGISKDSRAGGKSIFLNKEVVNATHNKVVKLNEIAKERKQTLAQMALAWVLRNENITSVLIGASSAKQVEDNVAVANNLEFSISELARIDEACDEA